MRALRREAPLLLAPPLRRRLRLRRVRPRRPAFDDHPGPAVPSLARARSRAPVSRLDRRLEPRLVGRLSRASVLPARVRDPGRRDPRRSSSGAPPSRRSTGSSARSSSSRPGVTTYVLLARVVGDRWLALPAAFLALTLSGGPPGRRRGRPPMGHAHDAPRARVAAAPGPRAAPLGRGRPAPALGAAPRRAGDPLPPHDAPVRARPHRPRDGPVAPGPARAPHAGPRGRARPALLRPHRLLEPALRRPPRAGSSRSRGAIGRSGSPATCRLGRYCWRSR